MSKVSFCTNCFGAGKLSIQHINESFLSDEICAVCNGTGWSHPSFNSKKFRIDYARALDAAVLAVEQSFKK